LGKRKVLSSFAAKTAKPEGGRKMLMLPQHSFCDINVCFSSFAIHTLPLFKP